MHTCNICGKEEPARYMQFVKDELEEQQLCFECHFWDEKLKWRKENNPNAVVTDTYRHYHIGDENVAPILKGFGGNKFVIKFHDGREVTTTNLWHQGTIPERFRDILTPNATLGYD